MYSISDDAKMRLMNSRTISYRYELCDKYNKAIGNVTATGTIDFDAAAKIKRVADLAIKETKDIDFISERIRPYMRLHNKNSIEEFPLGIFLMASPTRRSDGISVQQKVECYDTTQILEDDKFDKRMLIYAGENYTNAISNIINSSGIINYRIDPSDLELKADIEFDVGTSKLDAINKLLLAINYNELYADAYGVIRGRKYDNPEGRSIDMVYEAGKNSIVHSGAEEILDTFAVPNKIVRYLESADREFMISSVENTDPASKISTVSRGRTIVDIKAVYDIADQATLDAYVQRVAAENNVYQKCIFESAVMPNHEYLDCIYIDNTDINISGKFIEMAWNIDMKVGGRMRHTCRRAVKI